MVSKLTLEGGGFSWGHGEGKEYNFGRKNGKCQGIESGKKFVL